MGLLVNIDNGGTLTDICAFDGERVVHAKTVTTPHDLTECLMNGLQALGEQLGQIGISLIFILILLLKPTGLFGSKA